MTQNSCRYTKDSYTFLVKYLATFAGADPSTLNEAKEEAVRAVIEFVKSPDMFQVHLLRWNFK
jgi:translation initiation factor 3 subunit M